MAQQFVQGPGVEGLVLGFVGQDIVRGQGVQPVGQIGEAVRVNGARRARTPFDDEDIQALALEREFFFQFHAPGPIGEQIG